jgi:tetratricopeptide (TPR) repeat protein
LGSWDVSVFGNDESRAWLAELIGASNCEPIFRALVNAAKIGKDEYLQAPDCERALAAAELVACARGKASGEVPPNLKAWLAEQRFVAGAQIVDMAIQVIERIVTNSELKELWDDTDSKQEWLDCVESLRGRLLSTREAHTSRSAEHDTLGVETVHDLCEEAALLVAQQQYKEALAKYERALKLEPKSQVVLMGESICYLWMQDHERVVECINRALSAGDPIPEAYHLRSQGYFHLKKYRNAVADLTSYLRSFPEHTESYLIRGLSYQGMDQLDNAVADFTTVIDRKSKAHLFDAFVNRAQCYERIGRHDLAAWDRQRARQMETASMHLP